jgi:hypothetical protein
LSFSFLQTEENFFVGKITAILSEVLELVRYGTKALLSKEAVWFEVLGLADKEVGSFELGVFFKLSFKKFLKVTNKLRAQTFSLRIFFSLYHIEVGYQMLVQLNHKERGGKQDFKFFINFVDRPELLECLLSETKHVILFIEFPNQDSWRIFRLLRSNL